MNSLLEAINDEMVKKSRNVPIPDGRSDDMPSTGGFITGALTGGKIGGTAAYSKQKLRQHIDKTLKVRHPTKMSHMKNLKGTLVGAAIGTAAAIPANKKWNEFRRNNPKINEKINEYHKDKIRNY